VRSARNRVRATSERVPVVWYVIVSFAVLVFSGASVVGATISNRDDKEQTITIIEGDVATDKVLKPQEVLDKVCLKGCIIRLNKSEDDDYEIKMDDLVSIEDGFLYYDAPDTPPAEAPASPAPKP
jgi:hypothetical protein